MEFEDNQEITYTQPKMEEDENFLLDEPNFNKTEIMIRDQKQSLTQGQSNSLFKGMNNSNIPNFSEGNSREIVDIKTKLIEGIAKLGMESRLSNNEYNKTDTNYIFVADPKIVIFNGFVVNDTGSFNTYQMKVNLINVSKFSQRVAILPPTTPYFKIKFSRRGLIPTGFSETIYISFNPQKYQYYYDYIRVHCEGDEKIIIPIHAFPVMDIEVSPKYVPRYIDFNNIMINHIASKEITLKNRVDSAGFEYEFVSVKSCPEIQIVPLYGEIPPLKEIKIKINFNPQRYGIFTSEYEFRLSEFSFKPLKVSISGSCNIFEAFDPNKVNNEASSASETLKAKQDAIIGKISYPSMKRGKEAKPEAKHEYDSIYKRLNIAEVKESPQEYDNAPTQRSTKPKSSRRLIGFKSLNDFTLNKEKLFLEYFNKIDQAIKDKEIKYLRFIGKKLLLPYETSALLAERHNELRMIIEYSRAEDLARHTTERDKGKPNVLHKNLLMLKPYFSFNNNDKFFKSRVYYNRFLKAMTKIIINNRADKNLKAISKMLKDNNIKSAIDFSRFVEEDWSHHLNQEDQSDEFIKVRFNSNPAFENKSQILLPVDFNIEALKQVLPHENIISFDDYHTYTPFDRVDQEAIQYKEFRSPGISQYEISTERLVLRECATSESIIRREYGDSEFDFRKIYPLLNHDALQDYRKYATYEREDLLFFNPNLRRYCEYNYYIESNLDFNLQPKQLDVKGSVINYQYYMLDNLDFSNMSVKRKDLNIRDAIYDKWLDFEPERMENANERDLFIKKSEAIDEDNFVFDILKDDEVKFLEMIEAGDEVVRQERENNKELPYSQEQLESERTENYLRIQKKKWESTLPTMIEYYNEAIQQSENKIIP